MNTTESIRGWLVAKSNRKEYKRCRTGSDLLDMVVGGNKGVFGYPFGKIINIVGDKSSGKTFLANELIASAYYDYGDKLDWRYDDAESGYSFDTEGMYGLQIYDEEHIESSRTVEDWYGNLRLFIERMQEHPDRVGIYVLDSLDGLSDKATQERGEERLKKHRKGEQYDKGSYNMGKAAFLSKEFFKGVASLLEETNVLLVVVSQVRDNIDPFSFKKHSRAGGKALDFYAHTALWLATITKLARTVQGTKRTYGVVTRAKADKSKTPRPFREADFILRFDYGLDNTASNLDFLFQCRGDSGKLLASAKSIPWEPGEKKSAGNLKAFLKEEGYMEKLTADLGKKVKTGEMIDWIQTQEKELVDKFNGKFGAVFEYDDLIDYIEQNNLEAELTRRVQEKWEEIEAEISTNRKRKY